MGARTMKFYKNNSILLPVLLLLAIVLGSINASEEDDNTMMKITFQNELPEPVVIFYEGNERVAQNEGMPLRAKGGELTINTFPGHRFSYVYGGDRHFEEVLSPDNVEDRTSRRVLLAGNNEISVQCTVTANKKLEVLNLRIIPWWAPLGASHFIYLVRRGYYDGAALNRNVPGFLTQFGISSDYETRTQFRSLHIDDDAPLHEPIKFKPGMISYAGSGPNSRTTEIFIVAPGTTQGQLDHFGTNPWETPFGVIDSVEETAVSRWFAYGDMPPYVSFFDIFIIIIHSTFVILKFAKNHISATLGRRTRQSKNIQRRYQ